MLKPLRAALEPHPEVAYALLFGSAARGTAHARSDLDVAVGTAGKPLGFVERGELLADLERATGKPVHLIVLEEAPPGLAYRVFRNGVPLLVRDARALAAQQARAVLEYLDFQPVERLLTDGVLRGSRGR